MSHLSFSARRDAAAAPATTARRPCRAHRPASRGVFAGWLLTLPLLLAVAGCGSLLSAAPAPPAQFAIDMPPSRPAQPPRSDAAVARSTIAVSVPRVAAGFESSRIVYIRQPHQLEYFADNQWVDPPAQMLWPLLAKALEAGAAFKAVVASPTGASADWRVEVELLRLQHEFIEAPSRVRVTLRVQLIDSLRRSVVASREIEAVEPAASDDPYGGVVAANVAVARAVGEVASFVAEAASKNVAAAAAPGAGFSLPTAPTAAGPLRQPPAEPLPGVIPRPSKAPTPPDAPRRRVEGSPGTR